MALIQTQISFGIQIVLSPIAAQYASVKVAALMLKYNVRLKGNGALGSCLALWQDAYGEISANERGPY